MNNKQGINLFKTVRVERVKSKDTQLTYVFGTLAMLILSIGGLIGMFIWKQVENKKLQDVNSGITSIQAEINSASFTDLKRKVYELNRKAELISPLVERDVDIMKIINLARDELPDGVVLDSISVDGKGYIMFSGMSGDFTTVGKMMQSYLDSDNFSEFNIQSINRVDDKENLIDGVGFEIRFRYSKINYID